MLKKWIYIFSIFCLANSQPLLADFHSHILGSGTLLDMLIGQVQDDDDNDKTPAKASCRHFLSVIRGAAVNIQVPLVTIFGAFRLQGITLHFYSNRLIRKPILPDYYNFLFRLSPF
ncbi:MAG TPA: hypothetical protein VL727_05645 [Puia sp.]|jgi:hypothetical protein|nr:hypothetical protein [Puia sp.]